MTLEKDDDLSGWRFNEIFDTKHVPYIPNPPKKDNTYRRLDPTPPLAKAKESFDWTTVTTLNYIHVIRMEGYFRYERGRQLSQNFEGYVTKLLSPEIAKRGLRNGHSYYGAGGSFHLQWGWQHRFRPYGRYDLRLILRPKFRQSVWESLDGAIPVIKAVADRYSNDGLRMRYIEIASDFFGRFKREGLPQCIWRGWADQLHRPDDTNGETVYDGLKKRSRKNIIYEKEGAFHCEARWEAKGLRQRRAVFPSTASVLSLLLTIHRNMRFIYLDWNKLARSPSVLERAPGCWDVFLTNGIVSALKAMRPRISNPENKTSVHPINASFHEALVKTIQEGIDRLKDNGQLKRITLTKLARLDDRIVLDEIMREVEALVRPEYHKLPPLTPYRKPEEGD